MKIAQVAPLIERVPPPMYGGVELIVGELVEGLHNQGHEVTLFATGDSICPQKLVSVVASAMRGRPRREIWKYEFLQAAKVIEMSDDFDIIHCHFGPNIFPWGWIADLIEKPVVFTLHCRLDLPELKKIYNETDLFKRCYHVSISNDQRTPLPEAHYVATVYNGIEVEKYPFNDKKEDFLIFLGRSSPEKGIVEAIKIAKKAKQKLMVLTKVDPVDEEYFNKEVKPLIDGKDVILIGEVPFKEKVSWLSKAKAMLFPIQWKEPFGLVMIESMACGTPVIAPRRASVPEIVVDGTTGFIVSVENMIDEMVEKIKEIEKINPLDCRLHVEKNFTADKMVKEYLKVYEKILQLHKPFCLVEKIW
ncbi:glycosyltransferase family 4 protein [Thermodesulfovibrio sp. 3907-1M]|uniref:Glycosyltransferase family 4 protein n=1 Tax=Thermodesulfovibrio autotrophicus TaxID=3118333 RepID=A0AAU8GWM5_9BACT